MAILARHQFDATDEAGNILTDVIVEVRRESDSGLAVLYDGRDTTTAGLVGNPFTVASGKVGFHVIGGAYRVILTKGAYTRTLRYVGIGRASESDLTSNNPQGAWDIGATYSVGDLVTHPVGVGQFISLQNGNIGHQPDNTTPGDTAYWMYIGKMVGVDGVDGTGLFSRVRAVSTANITIATALNNGDTIDGVTLATNDLVLVAGQTAPAENGIYVVGASPARDSSFDTYDEHPGVYISVMEGTANADTLWRCTSNKGGTLNTTGIVFSQFSSGASSSAPNLLDNACFGIAQRGTLFTSTSTPANSDGALLFDRWVLLSDGNDIVDVGREATTVPTSGSTAVYLEVETANKKFGLVQLLTAQRSGPLIGGKASFSFKARKGGSNATVDKLRAAIITWSGTKDAPTKDVVSGTSWGAEGTNPTLATSWTYESTPVDLVLTTSYQEFKIENVNIDTASGKQVAVFIWCDNSDATVNDLVFISEAQLVNGSIVPTFAPLAEADDYSRCQPHLLRVTFASSGQRWVAGLVNNPSPVAASFGFSHAVPFWRAPDISQSNMTFISSTGAGGTTHTITSITLSYSAGNVSGFMASAATSDTYNLAVAIRSNATGAFIEFDAGIGI